jgi:transketolase
MTATFGTTAMRELATQLRVDSILASTSTRSGHPRSSTSAASLAEVMDAAGITAPHIITATRRLLNQA